MSKWTLYAVEGRTEWVPGKSGLLGIHYFTVQGPQTRVCDFEWDEPQLDLSPDDEKMLLALSGLEDSVSRDKVEIYFDGPSTIFIDMPAVDPASCNIPLFTIRRHHEC